MATMLAITALDLSREQREALCAGVEQAAADAFNINVKICELMILPTLPPENYGPSVKDTINYFVFSKSNKTDDQKCALMKNIYDATIKVTGPLPPRKVVVIIKEHDDVNVGAGDTLKLDM